MTIGLWQTIRCENADAQMSWLEAIGFTVQAVHRNEMDPSLVDHAQLLWGTTGGVMLGSHRDDGNWDLSPGTAGTYVVVDDPDDVHARAIAAGGVSINEPNDPPYGGREASVRDPEGNLWSFGTYSPA